MHHVVIERWSRGVTALHRLDPRAKIVALLAFLVTMATARRGLPELFLALLVLLCAALAAARVPVFGALARASVALLFAAVFAVACWAGGDPERGIALVLKSYLSALAVLTLVATTPLPALLRGLAQLRAPLFLLTVAQFVYRYLFVVSEEAQHMAKAAASRGGGGGGFRAARFRAAAGALAVLFARSYGRAEEVHQAMIARGFSGQLPTLAETSFGTRDALFAALASLAPVAARLAVESLH